MDLVEGHQTMRREQGPIERRESQKIPIWGGGVVQRGEVQGPPPWGRLACQYHCAGSLCPELADRQLKKPAARPPKQKGLLQGEVRGQE